MRFGVTDTAHASVYGEVMSCFEMHEVIPSGIPVQHLEEVRDALPEDANPRLRELLNAAIADPP